MLYAAYISLCFLGMQFINVFINFVFRQKLTSSEAEKEEVISVLIPARNEEENIGYLLSDLQKYPNRHLEILVFDDQSTDHTVNVVRDFSGRDKRIRLMQSQGLPRGWLGKNHACYQLAQMATGKYYLFIDADVRIEGGMIADAVAFMKKHRLGLLSIFPTQIQRTPGEKLSVPVMHYILLTLLPLIFVRISPFKSHAAANGQFMLFHAATYDTMQPHRLFKSSFVEDISIARFLKEQKIKIACLTGEKRIQCRMYRSYRESFHGFSKNVFMFFGNSPVLAFLFWVLAAQGFIPVLITLRETFLYYILGIISVQFLYSFTSRQNALRNTLLFPFHLIFLLQIMVNALLVKTQKKYSWKERNIYS
ncbi:MAG TPA: glycosyltransferase [Bacteroidetes bacterium]|nr:glycosyltransferase [Bacteroidota bacterium]